MKNQEEETSSTKKQICFNMFPENQPVVYANQPVIFINNL